MADTIREKIIAQLKGLFDAFDFAAVTAPGIYRGRQAFDPDSEPPPIVTILPRSESSEKNDYGMADCDMAVDVICLANIGENNPSELGEAILGELISCSAAMNEAYRVTLSFASAGYVNAVAGDIGKRVAGTTSGDTGNLIAYDNATKQWTIDPDGPGDTFDAVEACTITSGTGAGTLAAIGEQIKYIDGIEYRSGGIDEYPDQAGQQIIRVGITIGIRYQFSNGNPYTQ